MKSLVWLASYPKSGGELVEELFAQYQLTSGTQDDRLQWIFHSTKCASRRQAYERAAGRKGLSNQEIDELREAVQIDLSNRVRPPVLIKTHNARVQHNGFPIIRRELTLGAIYIVRNPLDVVDSVADHWGVDHDRAIAMMNDRNLTIGGPKQDLVTQYLESWSGHVTSWIDQRAFPVHVVCYEDLLARTEITFRNVLTFLGWDPDPERIERAIAETDFRRLQKREKEAGFGERSNKSTSGTFFRSGKAERWRDTLTEVQVNRVVEANADVMERFCYQTSVAARQSMD
ncbi:sulfotransferase domain-containing protein [Rosistilla oblonga]|uniref:Sulfotransferase domain protein n=1 Tax=Rosistilla oblonga TaxID=2527990 RepID=A0A518J033_9BACT|nr:sulfotransferase domain-containing protein [Rosistilla oblonga]QDV58698.1 Sulfotransferase domain protein [Rosistilla oblonga]